MADAHTYIVDISMNDIFVVKIGEALRYFIKLHNNMSYQNLGCFFTYYAIRICLRMKLI
jgi:hypothetical protein